MKEWNILDLGNRFKFSWKVAEVSFWSNETAVSFWENEKLSEMLRTIRLRLQSTLACIFALIVVDKGEKMAYA